MKKRTVIAVLMGLVFLCTACSDGSGGPAGEAAQPASLAQSGTSSQPESTAERLPSGGEGLSAEAKAADLDFLCETLDKKHKNMYANLSKEEFEKARQEIAAKLPEMSDSDFYYSLRGLVARIGDAHTSLGYRDSNYTHLNGLGFAVKKFEDGWHLLILEEANKALLGERLMGVNGVDIEELYRRAKTIVSHENETWMEMQFSNAVNFREALEYLGVVEKGAPVVLDIRKEDGGEETLEIQAMNEAEIMSAKMERLVPGKAPVMTTENGIYWAKPLDESTYAIQYNQCMESPDHPMERFVAEVEGEIRAGGYKKILIDMRYNTGGDSRVFEPMIEKLAQLKKERGFAVYTLIGGNTFSSGVLNSVQMKQQLDCIFVGTPTGGNVNGYGEVVSFDLPNAPITVGYSTKYFELVPGYEKDSLYPDIEVEQKFSDFKNGIDPELQTVLNIQ